MGQSYRIRTEIGISQTINLELNQDFEFLEILSLKIQQADVYTRSCANYGVVVGRVTANNGLGIPNAKVSLFIPVTVEDADDPTISAIYSFRQPSDVNEDGYRYNLLPYERSYSKHAATGTFPSKKDILTDSTAKEIFDRYYKYTVKTNDSGDYMIMGVPLGFQTFVMDVDLSDIGEFSLTPQDLIRMGMATESQVSGNQFRTSNDLSSLPQIISLTRSIEVSPLWGDPEICQIAINRLDFDLRDDANVDIQPTAVFMGSIYSSSDKYRVRKNGKPKDNLGNLCDLQSGPGQILAIRQTIQQGNDGNPILEQYRLEQSGNIIDEDGAWLTELPMNLDYIITNEFGERVISPDPSIGVPTKAKYRFKIKWQQAKDLTLQTRRAFFLVPNVKEYGWDYGSDPSFYDGNTAIEVKMIKEQRSSYYFGLDWSGYTEGMNITEANEKIQDIVNCNDTFYEFGFNRVYTVAGLIDQWKKGGRGRFIGIKEIDDDSCAASVNKFPVNEGFKNFDLIYFIFSLLFQILQFVGLALLIISHITIGAIYQIINLLRRIFGGSGRRTGIPIRLPMVTYPECEACECQDARTTPSIVDTLANGILTPLSSPDKYYLAWQREFENISYEPAEDINMIAQIHSQSMGGNNSSYNYQVYKVPKSDVVREVSEDADRMFCWSFRLPLGERINLFNTRQSYFNGVNKIKVSFANQNNPSSFHLDNTITVLSTIPFDSGQLLTSVDPATTTDKNFLYSLDTKSGITYGIEGSVVDSPTTITVRYANETQQLTENTQSYFLPYGSSVTNQIYPMDREYFQVVTAITVNDFLSISTSPSSLQSFPDILNSNTRIHWMEGRSISGFRERSTSEDRPNQTFKDYYEDFGEQYVLILQRGVDPYSPKYVNKYNLGLLFGSTIDNPSFSITANTRVNIPIQKLTNSNLSVQPFDTQASLFYNSYFFEPGLTFSSFTSSTIGYYGDIDSTYLSRLGEIVPRNFNGALGIRSITANEFEESAIDEGSYDASEDLSGNALLYGWDTAGSKYNDWKYKYFTYSSYPNLLQNPMTLANRTLNVMRLDRLPSSDKLDGGSWDTNPAMLQQNINFVFYEISEPEEQLIAEQYGTGFQEVQPDIEGEIYEDKVVSSFSCNGMVSLGCYNGAGETFGVNEVCAETDAVENGCYVFFTNPLFGLTKDIRNFQEWGYRFRFFYGICRGVLSQTFTNNWINGSLFAFPIQVDTFYGRDNKPLKPEFSQDVVYYNTESNNFYYRSSPYNNISNKFVGKPRTEETMVNTANLLFPTTIANLGFKDSFYSEIVLDPSTNSYIIDKLSPTSYGDNSDLINLFVISRIIDENFLSQFFSFASRNNSIDQLFTRNKEVSRNRRVDGDLAQLMSINSEEGVIKFSTEFYQAPEVGTIGSVGIYGTPGNPTIGVFFSSTTENLQLKDFITPGRIDFRSAPQASFTPYKYDIKSQLVPFYKWDIKNTSQIFGTEQNNWATKPQDIFQKNYQSLDRTTIEYFQGSGIVNDLNMRGYIFNVSNDTLLVAGTDYKPSGPAKSSQVVVGAPFHFYFGTVVGASALDKFKQKYAIDE